MTVDSDEAELTEPERTVQNTALVLIDFQRDFCEAGGYADTIDDIGFAREVVPRLDNAGRGTRTLADRCAHQRGVCTGSVRLFASGRLRSARGGAATVPLGPLAGS